MNVMFDSSDFFIRIRNKSGHIKITIWNNSGDKLISDFASPDPTASFWSAVKDLTSPSVAADIKDQLNI